MLAVGAHPDDVEIGCGGALLQVTRGGGRASIVDLTAGERATRGSAETRAQEAEEAARTLGVLARENLALPDGGLHDDDDSRRALAAAIRLHRPRVLFAPHPLDDHPDHAAAGKLAVAANFLAGVGGFDAGGERHRASIVLFYMMHHRFVPAVIVDITPVFEAKIHAIRCYRSQLHVASSSAPPTNIGAPDFLERIQARHRYFGEIIRTEYGEAFASLHPPGIGDVRTLVG